MSDQSLKYLYEAEFADGEVLVQPEDNISSLKPDFDKDGWRPSAFYDVTEKAKSVLCTRFSIIGDGHRYTVDLIDGHFEIDGMPFIVHPQGLKVWSTEDNPLRLIYHRETKQEQNMTYTVNESGGIDMTEGEMGEKYVSRYFLGWQTNLSNGENIQHTIAIE